MYTIVLGTLSLGSSLFETRGYFAHWCARTWAWLILLTTGVRCEVEGLERAQAGRTYVFVSNHQSIYDIPCSSAALPYQLRIIAKESLGPLPVSRLAPAADRPHAGRPRAVPIGRDLRMGATADSPRGCRSSCSPRARAAPTGACARFKAGSFLLALEAGLPVVPLSIVGSRTSC